MLVGKRMSPNPITIHQDTPVTEAQALMRREKVHHLPVVDKRERLIGIVSEKDLLYASPSPATSLNVWEVSYLLSKLSVEKVMSSKVATVTEDTPIEDAARIMSDNNVGGLPVLRGSQLVGIITESDLFHLFIELFGARHKGTRITLLVPEQPGELARITSAVAAKGGNIISMGTFLGEDPSTSLCTLKVEGVPQAALVAELKPLSTRIVDVRDV
jgi:acetoin utilization protein AcuB